MFSAGVSSIGSNSSAFLSPSSRLGSWLYCVPSLDPCQIELSTNSGGLPPHTISTRPWRGSPQLRLTTTGSDCPRQARIVHYTDRRPAPGPLRPWPRASSPRPTARQTRERLRMGSTLIVVLSPDRFILGCG